MARLGSLACNWRGALAVQTHSHPTNPGWAPGHSRAPASVGNWARPVWVAVELQGGGALWWWVGWGGP